MAKEQILSSSNSSGILGEVSKQEGEEVRYITAFTSWSSPQTAHIFLRRGHNTRNTTNLSNLHSAPLCDLSWATAPSLWLVSSLSWMSTTECHGTWWF